MEPSPGMAQPASQLPGPSVGVDLPVESVEWGNGFQFLLQKDLVLEAVEKTFPLPPGRVWGNAFLKPQNHDHPVKDLSL